MTFSTGRINGVRAITPTAWLIGSVLMCSVAFARAGAQAPMPPDTTAVAKFVGSEACLECHKEKGVGFANSLHGKAVDKRTPAAAQGCETCHGPGSKHIEDPDVVANRPRNFSKLTADKTAAVCTSCHTSGDQAFWAASKHAARRVACTSCHSVHDSKGEKLLKTETQPKLCASCHQNIVNKLSRFDHMPVREGKLECSSCHNTHGSANVKMLRAGTTVDEACTSCHAEKRGPYLWEHAPVANSCVTCHDPHGSSNERMLVSKVPFLCQRCHVTSRHPPTVYDASMIATTSNANKITGRGCVICHAQIHGSNAPSGKALLR
jgi:DmsE family decaheme c-type cytochrome